MCSEMHSSEHFPGTQMLTTVTVQGGRRPWRVDGCLISKTLSRLHMAPLQPAFPALSQKQIRKPMRNQGLSGLLNTVHVRVSPSQLLFSDFYLRTWRIRLAFGSEKSAEEKLLSYCNSEWACKHCSIMKGLAELTTMCVVNNSPWLPSLLSMSHGNTVTFYSQPFVPVFHSGGGG